MRLPRRRPNRELRTREYLTPAEVDRLIAAAGASGRYHGRDQTLLMLMYRHGLRVSEAVSLRWEQVDLKAGLLHVTRLKNGVPSTHPLRWSRPAGAASAPARLARLPVPVRDGTRRADDF